MSSDEVHPLVLGAESCSLTETVAVYQFRWLGHVLHMPAHCLIFHALFRHAVQRWKKRRGDQALTWRRGMKN